MSDVSDPPLDMDMDMELELELELELFCSWSWSWILLINILTQVRDPAWAWGCWGMRAIRRLHELDNPGSHLAGLRSHQDAPSIPNGTNPHQRPKNEPARQLATSNHAHSGHCCHEDATRIAFHYLSA